jgi:hyperosmotically inducible periplasmic protein
MKVAALGIAALAGALALAGCEKENPPNTNNPPRTTPSTSTPSTPRSPSTTTPARPAPDKDADNTAQNKRDRDKDTITPPDQGESKEAVRITADIRKALMDDKGLSTNAHNVKVVTDNSGNVTLRGVVDSQAEKDSVEEKAKSVTGVSRVTNELQVKTGG